MTIEQYIKLKRLIYVEAAAQLDVDYTTLYRWINSGAMPRKETLKKIREWSGGAVTANDFTS